MTRLNSALGLKETLLNGYKAVWGSVQKTFKNQQNLFKGVTSTYEPLDGYADDPSKRGVVMVETTVDEQLLYAFNQSADYLATTFSIEKTNASGSARAELIIDGNSWGEYTSLELLRLKSIINSASMKNAFDVIPTRKLQMNWNHVENHDLYGEREIYSSDMLEGYAKTTIKQPYILEDPHPDLNRAPVMAERNTQVNIGKYTTQQFSGEMSLHSKAALKSRLTNLNKAVLDALERANSIEIQQSDLGDKLLSYLSEDLK